MKRILILLFLGISIFALLDSCQKQALVIDETIPGEVIDKIARMGFNPEGISIIEEGFLIEGDIVITKENLEGPRWQQRVPGEEQYSTFNLVENTPRTISVYIDKKLGSDYEAGLQEALDRYNDEPISLSFTLTRSKKQADIVIKGAPRFASYLASAGFPTDAGDPHDLIRVNKKIIDGYVTGDFTDFLGTLFAHEIGHCIGFRHTDWFDRSISCGGNPVYEGGETTIGAEHIPGTPTGADPESFMLSCLGSDTNRPFTGADQTALDYLY